MSVQQMKQILSSCVFLICIFGGVSARAADAQKERRLAECKFETEKVLVLYEIIYESGRLGKADEDYFEAFLRQRNSKADQILKEYSDNVLAKKEAVRLRLMDKCMIINGLRYDSSAASCLANGKGPRSYSDRAYYENDADCWK